MRVTNFNMFSLPIDADHSNVFDGYVEDTIEETIEEYNRLLESKYSSTLIRCPNSDDIEDNALDGRGANLSNDMTSIVLPIDYKSVISCNYLILNTEEGLIPFFIESAESLNSNLQSSATSVRINIDRFPYCLFYMYKAIEGGYFSDVIPMVQCHYKRYKSYEYDKNTGIYKYHANNLGSTDMYQGFQTVEELVIANAYRNANSSSEIAGATISWYEIELSSSVENQADWAFGAVRKQDGRMYSPFKTVFFPHEVTVVFTDGDIVRYGIDNINLTMFAYEGSDITEHFYSFADSSLSFTLVGSLIADDSYIANVSLTKNAVVANSLVTIKVYHNQDNTLDKSKIRLIIGNQNHAVASFDTNNFFNVANYPTIDRECVVYDYNLDLTKYFPHSDGTISLSSVIPQNNYEKYEYEPITWQYPYNSITFKIGSTSFTVPQILNGYRVTANISVFSQGGEIIVTTEDSNGRIINRQTLPYSRINCGVPYSISKLDGFITNKFLGMISGGILSSNVDISKNVTTNIENGNAYRDKITGMLGETPIDRHALKVIKDTPADMKTSTKTVTKFKTGATALAIAIESAKIATELAVVSNFPDELRKPSEYAFSALNILDAPMITISKIDYQFGTNEQHFRSLIRYGYAIATPNSCIKPVRTFYDYKRCQVELPFMPPNYRYFMENLFDNGFTIWHLNLFATERQRNLDWTFPNEERSLE